MTSDGDVWVRLDCNWYQHPKFLQLIMDKQWQAIVVCLAGLGYAGASGHDGFIPYYALGTLNGTTRIAALLCDVGLWECSPEGWQVHGWREYQRTSEEREAASAKARNAALVRWEKEKGKKKGT